MVNASVSSVWAGRPARRPPSPTKRCSAAPRRRPPWRSRTRRSIRIQAEYATVIQATSDAILAVDGYAPSRV